jgi:hypothetical protein
MNTIIVESTATAQWRKLVSEAAASCDCPLDEELESYLVFLLMRFVGRPDMAGNALALEYLQGLLQAGNQQRQQLRDVGDKCLLYSGLFPLRARRRLVRIKYYVDLGRSAYRQLSGNMQHEWAEMFDRLAQYFVPLMDILQATRDLGGAGDQDALLLHELSSECGSQRATRNLARQYGVSFIAVPGSKRH